MNIEQFIGRHFKLKHLIWLNTAASSGINNFPGIDNSPTQSQVIRALTKLMENIVDPIVDVYPNLVITSAYRSIQLNTNPAIGGSGNSQHCYGEAIDLQVPGLSTAELYNYIYYNVSGWDQLIWEYPERGIKSWVHVSYSEYRTRKRTTLASNSINYHNLYGGLRRGNKDQYQDGITDAKIV